MSGSAVSDQQGVQYVECKWATNFIDP